ncbi:MOSC domain-containing protein [Caenimonas sp. SL110]|uniref:MOSC domain-containing protein n=1 Tax=Caenimonas sp. SL110 TaxID=1450524 RepID=UPI0006529BFC|nr:MOSC domain-containing protein [Caenimonas sp. SL110]
MGQASVVAVHSSAAHSFSKFAADSIELVAGLGVRGDAHAGQTVKHRSRVKRDPHAPNLRQVHLIHAELFDELMAVDHAVWPGDMGENITTRGVDLLALPTGARLRIGKDAVVEVTGLRNPCSQIDKFQRGLMQAVLGQGERGELVRKAGVMGVVIAGGEVKAGDTVEVLLPALPHVPLAPV